MFFLIQQSCTCKINLNPCFPHVIINDKPIANLLQFPYINLIIVVFLSDGAWEQNDGSIKCAGYGLDGLILEILFSRYHFPTELLRTFHT